MEGIGDKGLRVQEVAPETLAYSHAEIDIKANSRNTDTGILFVCRDKVRIIMMMVLMGVAAVRARQGCGAHYGTQAAAEVVTRRVQQRADVAVSGRGREYDKRSQWDARVRTMCPDQGSATEFGGEKISTRLEALQSSRKRHESSTLVFDRYRQGRRYILDTDEHIWTDDIRTIKHCSGI